MHACTIIYVLFWHAVIRGLQENSKKLAQARVATFQHACSHLHIRGIVALVQVLQTTPGKQPSFCFKQPSQNKACRSSSCQATQDNCGDRANSLWIPLLNAFGSPMTLLRAVIRFPVEAFASLQKIELELQHRELSGTSCGTCRSSTRGDVMAGCASTPQQAKHGELSLF